MARQDNPTINYITATASEVQFNPTEAGALIDYVHARLTTDATVGNRKVRLELENHNSVLQADFHTAQTQAASLTYHYNWTPGSPYRETTLVDNELMLPIPMNLYVPRGWTLQVRDVNGVSASDSWILTVQYTAS